MSSNCTFLKIESEYKQYVGHQVLAWTFVMYDRCGICDRSACTECLRDVCNRRTPSEHVNGARHGTGHT